MSLLFDGDDGLAGVGEELLWSVEGDVQWWLLAGEDAVSRSP